MYNHIVSCPYCSTSIMDTNLSKGRVGVFHMCPTCSATFEEEDADFTKIDIIKTCEICNHTTDEYQVYEGKITCYHCLHAIHCEDL